MSSENTNQRNIWLGLGRRLVTLFRVNNGRGWISSLGPKGVKKLANGSVLISAARSIAIGFAFPTGECVPGVSDLDGWTKIVITPEMVGHTIPVFTVFEIKEDERKGDPEKKASKDQLNYISQVKQAGGIGGVVCTIEQANAVIDDWHAKFKLSPLL